DVVNTRRLAVLVHEQVANYGVADQSEAAVPSRGRKRHCGAVEVGRCVTSALTLIAVVTRRTPVVRNGEVGDTIRHHAPAEFSFNDLLGKQRPAGEVHGRQEPSVRHLLQALSRTAHADEAFNLVVVRLQVLVAEGPVLLVPIATGRFAFVITLAVDLSRPAERLATDLAAANPHERLVQRKRVGVFVIVDEELMTVFVAGVAKSLDGLPFEQRSLVPEAAEGELIRPDIPGAVSGGDAVGAWLEDRDVH